MPQKVLITGATGLLGRQVVKAFEQAEWDTVGTGFTRADPPKILKVDLQNEEEILRVLGDVRPDIVVHCAAERFPDKCLADPDRVKALNIAASSHLARETSSLGIPLIYISTDYVFPGTPNAAPYHASSPTSPPNFYGETKLAGEVAVLAGNPKSVILRVPVLYGEGENKESAVNVLLDAVWNKEGKEKVEMEHWAIRYPTNVEDVGRVIKDIAVKYTSEQAEELPRILQFSSEDKMTKYEMCEKLGEILGLPIDHLVPNSENDPTAAVQRPYDCHLSTHELKDVGVSVDTVPFDVWWRRELRAFKK